jgi:FkbM family methyltransferase
MKTLVQSLLRPFGLHLEHIDRVERQPFGPEVLFSVLRRNGFAPRHVIDIGANHGHWTRKALPYFPDATFTLVEPQAHLRQDVEDLIAAGRVRWVHAGAGDAPGRLPLAISERDDSSTFAAALPAGGRSTLVDIRTLDEIAASSGLPLPELVKVDAEGFDMKVLAGASTLLGRTEIFFAEAVVCCPDYSNTALELVQFMDRAGYRLIDVTELNRSPRHNVLWLVELAFLLRGSKLLASAATYA